MKKTRTTVRPRRPRIDVTRYAGQWVAVDPITYAVAGHDRSPKQAGQAARKAGVSEPLLLFVPTSDAYFVGAGT